MSEAGSSKTGFAKGKVMMLSTAQVDAWVRTAKPGDVLLYARQPVLSQKAALGEHVRAIAERGLVRHEPQRRCAEDNQLFEYRIRRTDIVAAGRKDGGGRGPRSAREAGDALFRGADSALGVQLLALIVDAAVANAPCPPEKALSAAVGRSLDHVRREMARLRLAGELVLERRRGDFGLPRRVAILPRYGLATAARPFVDMRAAFGAARI